MAGELLEVVYDFTEIEHLRDDLMRAAVHLVPESFRGAGEELGLFIEREAKGHVPVDTGRLRASIGHGPDGVWKLEQNAAQVRVTVGTNVEYAPYMEFGFRHPGGVVVNIPGVGFRYIHPFSVPGFQYMRKAMMAAERAAEAILLRHLMMAMRKAGLL